MSNRIQKTEEDDLESVEIAFVYKRLHKWKFFQPSIELAEEVLRLNDTLGGAYFDGEYAALEAREGEESVEDVDWFRSVLRQASDVLSHEEGEGDVRPFESEEEELSFFRASISERIFNHLAMLARSRHAAQGGAFSIREELTTELAEKIGLGLYLHRKTSPELRAAAESVLLRLAAEFQHWLVDVKGGAAETLWGMICAEGTSVARADDEFQQLLLTPDVEAGEASGKGK